MKLLDEQFEAALIGALNVKGKAEKVTIFQILGEKAPKKITAV